METIILDCYTDEPSGYGVRPFLGSHQIHLSQALETLRIPHQYITIEDLRKERTQKNTDIDTFNSTKNRKEALDLLTRAKTIYIVMGCFVEYDYFNSRPPKADEVLVYLRESNATKILFYVMGTAEEISPDYQISKLKEIISEVEPGNTYRYVFKNLKDNLSENHSNLINPDYKLLDNISSERVPIISDLKYPIIAEIETGTGCNTPFCSFCIESVRSPKVIYREPKSIIKQIKSLYDSGVKHFRLGRQPNFYHYQNQNIDKLEELLYGIRNTCPSLETLHIDNVNIINVIGQKGIEFTKKIVKYCTSGNVAPFGIESFDENVRKETGVIGSSDQVMKAIEIINEYGAFEGDDGFPQFLPGINLIFNLPGSTEKTHEINLNYLRRIIEKGLKTRRLYFRNITKSK
jgi:radical SAM superfamily enzyme with C-terminal helix-hairpin-helix motif